MADQPAPILSAAPVVALAAWLVPGSGYLLIGQWARGITIGVTVISLFLAGILVAGVRVMEVPGYTDHGTRRNYDFVQVPEVQPDLKNGIKGSRAVIGKGWVMKVAPLSELRDKPWSVPQVMAGPIAIITAIESVRAAAPVPGDPVNQDKFEAPEKNRVLPGQQAPFYKGIGAVVHARLNDIGSLYLSVAGLLNLMAIIDSAHRSTRLASNADESAADISTTEAVPTEKAPA